MQPDCETEAVAWAKANAAIAAIAGDSVATRLPKDWGTVFLRLTVVDASIVVVETADIVSAVLQWDAYAKTSGGVSPDYATASSLARTLISEAVGARTSTVLGFGAISGPQRVEEPEARWARYRVDTLIVVRS